MTEETRKILNKVRRKADWYISVGDWVYGKTSPAMSLEPDETDLGQVVGITRTGRSVMIEIQYWKSAHKYTEIPLHYVFAEGKEPLTRKFGKFIGKLFGGEVNNNNGDV